VSVKGTHVEDKMRRFKGECALFRFNKCPIFAHEGATVQVPNLALQQKRITVHLTSYLSTARAASGIHMKL
jgi:hypothetical protein